MKFFWVNSIGSKNIKLLLLAIIVLATYSCATHHPQYGKNAHESADSIPDKKPEHRFYLVGDAGLATSPQSKQLLSVITPKLQKDGKKATLLYLGDNIYPLGMPPKEAPERAQAEASLGSQLDVAKKFDGKTYIIPGNHDWYHGLDGLHEQEDFVKAYLNDKKAFQPTKGCPINDIEITDNITLIVIDSEWYLEDWDKYPAINDDCIIKTREGLFTELDALLNKNQDKTVILALHHPLMSNGTHGGQFSWRKQLYPFESNVPLPLIGSFANLLRKTTGASTQDLQSRVYATLSKRIRTLVQDKNNVVVVSGHEHNLQYLHSNNIRQIISGAGSKSDAARAISKNDFSYGGTGYAVLDIFKNGTASVAYYATKDGKDKLLFEAKVLEKVEPEIKQYPTTFPSVVKAYIYPPELTKKSGFYRFLFGDHYRSYYSMPIKVKSASLDTLHGGLTPIRAGGGHQSMSLRLTDANGREYVMRGLKKSATRFLQTVAFKDRYVGNDFDNTFAEKFLLDFYTSSHPYTPFILDDLSESAGILHSNPELYYIPKQNRLEKYNDEFGDELYMVEERPINEQKDVHGFGNPDAIESTDDLMVNLQKNKKYTVDEKAYIRARLFDILIGDWDRHSDQWRWARYNTKDSIIYKPIPRDRDQAFPKYGGTLLSILMNIPALRYMKPYKDHISNVKWLARAGYAQDLAIINQTDKKIWLSQVRALQQSLTDKVIDNAFALLPKEVQDGTMETIKSSLKKRRDDLEKYALEYREALLRTVLVPGTDKKEKFSITRLPNGETKIEIYALTGDSETLLRTNTYNRKETKEIWVYGLDDDDVFEVKGKPDHPILLRLLGGQNHDSYIVENGKKVKVYDFKSKQNTYTTDKKTKLLLTDDYETNSYDYTKPQYNIWAGYPMIGYNPDDGVKMGVLANYTVNSFNRRPYSQKHALKANYFFATNGFEFGYSGTFMNVASKWNIGLDVGYTSPNFSINYFGYGNATVNNDDDLGMDYNRVKLQVFRAAPYLFKKGRNGSEMQLQAVFEALEVEDTNNRFVNEPGAIPTYLFEHRQYAGINAKYSFSNYDNTSLPGMGMLFYITAGWKASMDQFERNFPSIESSLNFAHRITKNNKLVLSTTFKGKVLFNNNFEFYQAAMLGGDNDLRGYRQQRYNGKQSVYQSTDLRFAIGKWKSSILPVKYGVYAGYDYGRVWIPDEASRKWHQSVGGGFWVNGVDALTAKVFYFQGTDGGRVAFALAFGI
jgi:hypothetical protein